MSNSKFEQAINWAGVIREATSLCYEMRPEWDNSSFFTSVSQAVKAKLDHTIQRKLLDTPEVLEALVTPFFLQTSYSFDVKEEVKNDIQDGRLAATRTIWVPGGTRKAEPIVTGLAAIIKKYPDHEGAKYLKARIESLAMELPGSLRQKFGLCEDCLQQVERPVEAEITPEPAF